MGANWLITYSPIYETMSFARGFCRFLNDHIVSFWLVMIRMGWTMIKLHHRKCMQRLNYSGLCTISIHPVHAAEMLEAGCICLQRENSQLTRSSWCFSRNALIALSVMDVMNQRPKGVWVGQVHDEVLRRRALGSFTPCDWPTEEVGRWQLFAGEELRFGLGKVGNTVNDISFFFNTRNPTTKIKK